MDTVQIVSFAFGAVCFFILLIVVLKYPNPTEFQYTFLRIMLSIGCACVAVVLTGFLEIKIKGFIQAGGALAVFVIIFFYRPAALGGTEPWREVKELWRNVRDIHEDPNEANPDDVVRALNVVNETGNILSNNVSLLNSFKTDHQSLFCRLFRKLRDNKYHIASENSTTDLLLSSATKQLAQNLGC
jgi:hypothetical protein